MNIKCKNCQESFEPLNDEDLCHWCLVNLQKEIDFARKLYNDSKMLEIHACQKCGSPGAELHFPGGYLCPGGCKTIKEINDNYRNWKDDQYER